MLGLTLSTFSFFQNDNTSLHYAAQYGHIDIVKFLIYHGAIIEAVTKVAIVISFRTHACYSNNRLLHMIFTPI